MTPPLRLAVRDLAAGRGGLTLLALCLALALAGIAVVTSLTASVDGAIAANSRQLLGGDLLLRVAQRPASADEQAAIAALGRWSRETEVRAMAVTDDGRSQLVELSAVGGDWPLAGGVRYRPGGRPPASGEAAIGRDLADRLRLAPGDALRLGTRRFTVSGILDALPSAGAGLSLSPPVLIAEADLPATGLIQPGSLYSTAYRLALDAPDPRAVGEAFRARFPDAGWQLRDRGDAGGGTRSFIARTGQLLLLIAIAALAIGGLGIASAARAFAASRRRTVAVLKTLGARRRQLVAMLAAEVALVAAPALVLGLGAGAIAPALLARFGGHLFPVAPDPAPQAAALALSAAVGLLVTLAACWPALADAIATRPAAVLRDLGDEGTAQPRARRGARLLARLRASLVPLAALALAAAIVLFLSFDRLFVAFGLATLALLAGLFALFGLALRRLAPRLARLGGPLFRLGAGGLGRPGAATVRLSVALGLSLTLLVALSAVGSSLTAELDRSVPQRAPALFLVDIPAAEADRFRALAATRLPGAELRLVPSLRGPVTALNGVAVRDMANIPEGAWILRGDRGLTFLADLPPGNRVVSGQWWPSDYRGPPLVSLDAEAAKILGLKVGDRMTVAIMGRPVEARIASLREIDWRSLGFNFAIIFAPGTLESAPYTMMATVAPGDGVSVAAFERDLVAALPMVSAIRTADIVAEVKRLLASLDSAVTIASAVAILVGMVVLAGAVVASRPARARDLVLLRLVGATRARAAATQAIEFALLSAGILVSSTILGATLALVISSTLFELPFRPDPAALAAIPLAALILSVLAALAAAWPAITAKPAPTLRSL